MLDHTFLEALFWKVKEEKGERRPPSSLDYEGHKISRSATRKLSNSGKSRGAWSVSFHVTPPEGQPYTVADPISPNRRNDPERNWGLGRD
jgi:hypothetical protein